MYNAIEVTVRGKQHRRIYSDAFNRYTYEVQTVNGSWRRLDATRCSALITEINQEIRKPERLRIKS